MQIKIRVLDLVTDAWPVESNFETLVQYVRDRIDSGHTIELDFTGYNRWCRSSLGMIYDMLDGILPPGTVILAKHDTVPRIPIIWAEFYPA